METKYHLTLKRLSLIVGSDWFCSWKCKRILISKYLMKLNLVIAPVLMKEESDGKQVSRNWTDARSILINKALIQK